MTEWKRRKDIKTVTYDAGDGFFVDIVEKPAGHNGAVMYQAWLYKEDSSHGMFACSPRMFSWETGKDGTTKREFIRETLKHIADDKAEYNKTAASFNKI